MPTEMINPIDAASAQSGEWMDAGDQPKIEVKEEPLAKRLDPEHKKNLHGRLLAELDRRYQRAKRHIEQREDDWGLVDKYMRLYLDLKQKARNSDGSYDNSKREHPYKRAIAVPLMYHIIMTRMAFLFNHFTSADPFVHLEAVSSDGFRKSRLMEARLNKDVRATNNNMRTYQMLFDNERYGLCGWKLSFEETWKKGLAGEYYTEEELMALDMEADDEEMILDTRGNRWRAIDPRTLLIDPEMSAGEASQGEFIGDRTYVNWLHISSARLSEQEGPYINVDRARRMHTKSPRNDDGRDSSGGFSNTEGLSNQYPTLEVYTLQWRLIPADFGLSDCKRPEVWEFAVANEHTIIRAHKIDHGRGGFTYYVGQGDPDQHAPFTSGMGQMMIGMQQASNFLATSHYVNARKAVNDQLVYNDDLMRAADLKNPSAMRHIRLTREGKIMNKRGMDINRMYGQLAVTDITRQHMETLKFITADAQRMASTPDTMQGMPLPSKRTLGEIENVNQSATVRLGITAQLLDSQVIEPCMMDAVHNLSTKLDTMELVQLTGRLYEQLGGSQDRNAGYIPVEPGDLEGHYEYIARTPTMAKDPARSAQVWGTIMGILSTAPQLLNPMPDGKALNPHAIFNEYIRSMGVDYFDNFYFNTQPTQPQAIEGQNQILPQDKLEEGERKGDIVPLEEYLG